MRILYAETTAWRPSSAHFLEALERLRGQVEFRFLDEAKYLNPVPTLAERIAGRVAGTPMRGYRGLNRAMIEQAAGFKPDLILVGKGSNFAPATLKTARQSSGAILVNWASDDPFNPPNSSRDLIGSIPAYDLYVSTKLAVIPDIVRAGCANVAYSRFGYKPEVHFPESPATDDERIRFACDVMFAGGCDPDRIPYFEALIRALPGIRLHLYGAYWDRVPSLRRYARGIVTGRDYRLAAGGAKISVNLVRRSNRDDHVMRTFEVPACGGFMLNERTSTHADLFAEDQETAFFATPEQLVAQVRNYLDRDADRGAMAAAAHRKITQGRHQYADRLAQILDLARPLIACRRSPAAANGPARAIESHG